MLTMYCGNAADSKTINGFVLRPLGGALNTLTIRMFWSLQRGKLQFELVFAIDYRLIITKSNPYWQELTLVFCFATTDS